MNRKLNGERFTRDELIALCIEAGTITAEQVTLDVKTWVFSHRSRDVRYAMFCRGEAQLDTRNDPKVPKAPLCVDRELLAFLGVTW